MIRDGPRPLQFQAAIDRVFVATPDGGLSAQAISSEGRSDAATGLGLVVADFDGDGANEIFVANDLMPNQLWRRRNESGREEKSSIEFVDEAVFKGVANGGRGLSLGCMGVAASDFDGNGLLDLHITNFIDQWSNQYMQREDHGFDDLALPFQLDIATYPMVGFGTEALDYDNNSITDLVMGNGHIEDTGDGSEFRMPTQLFGGTGSEFNLLTVKGDKYWTEKHLARGLITCDWNRDGKIDVAVTDLLEPFALFENQTTTDHHWVQFRLVGTQSERDAIGADVKVKYRCNQSNCVRTLFVTTGDGYLCRNESTLSLGLGEADAIDLVEVRWPSGVIQRFEHVGVNHRWLVVEDRSGGGVYRDTISD